MGPWGSGSWVWSRFPAGISQEWNSTTWEIASVFRFFSSRGCWGKRTENDYTAAALPTVSSGGSRSIGSFAVNSSEISGGDAADDSVAWVSVMSSVVTSCLVVWWPAVRSVVGRIQRCVAGTSQGFLLNSGNKYWRQLGCVIAVYPNITLPRDVLKHVFAARSCTVVCQRQWLVSTRVCKTHKIPRLSLIKFHPTPTKSSKRTVQAT